MKDANRQKKYSAVKTRLFIAGLVFSLALSAFFFLFLSPWAYSFSESFSDDFYIVSFFFSSLFFIFLNLASWPLDYYKSFKIERDFDLSGQTFFSWLKDELKAKLLSYGFFILSVIVFLIVLRSFEVFWWLILGGIWFFFSMLLSRLLPVLIIPIFFNYSELDDHALKEDILRLGAKMKVFLTDVVAIDFSRRTKKANAALVGMGKTRKVILSDTLLNDFSSKEILSVVAHEFGHYKKRHIWKLLFFGGGITLTAFYLLQTVSSGVAAYSGFEHIWDIRLLPVYYVLVIFFSLLVMPLQNWFSRRLEKEADEITLANTRDPHSFISMMERLADLNLAERDPAPLKKFFLYDHPPVAERIRFAENFWDSK